MILSLYLRHLSTYEYFSRPTFAWFSPLYVVPDVVTNESPCPIYITTTTNDPCTSYSFIHSFILFNFFLLLFSVLHCVLTHTNRLDTTYTRRTIGIANVPVVIIHVHTSVRPESRRANDGRRTWHICAIFQANHTPICVVAAKTFHRRRSQL